MPRKTANKDLATGASEVRCAASCPLELAMFLLNLGGDGPDSIAKCIFRTRFLRVRCRRPGLAAGIPLSPGLGIALF